ncbi:MAG: LPS assembly protein LptD [Bdellovibrionota bacterium]
MVQVFQRLASLTLLLLLLSGNSAMAASAKIRGMVVNFDNLSRDSELELVNIEGNVQIVKDQEHIKCDKAVIHMRSQQVELYGNVSVVSPQATIAGEYILLDYETQTGLIYSGYVQSGQVYFEGKLIQKTGPSEFLATEADYTTCTNCPATWSFQGSHIRAELGGYAYIKNSLMRVGGVPVFWLPYLVVPLKSDRQSGLLTPELEQSTEGGLTFAESYFWAIDRSTDATFTLKNYERRGLKTLINYRYVLDDNSAGEVDVGYLGDKYFANTGRLNDFRPESERGTLLPRWFIKYKHLYEMPSDVSQRIQVNHASDLQYPKDFPLETGNYGDAAMEDRMSVSQRKKDFYWHIDTSYYTNMLRANPVASNDDAVHRLPEIQMTHLQTNIGDTNFNYRWDVNYTNFYRNGQGWDDLYQTTSVNGTPIRYIKNSGGSATCDNQPGCYPIYDGTFARNKNADADLIRTGQRLDINPSISYPFSYFGLEFLPQVSYRETHYLFNIENVSPSARRLLRAEIASAATFSRVYGDLSDAKSNRMKHEFIPQVTYTRAPWIDQSTHPFFGFDVQYDPPISSKDSISDGDLGSSNGLQFDYNDRIYDSHLVMLGFVNRWTRKTWADGVPTYRQVVLWSLSQSYDAYKADLHDNKKPPWSDVASLLNVKYEFFDVLSTINFYPYHHVANTSTRVTARKETGEFVMIGLTNQYKIVSGEEVRYSTLTEDYTFGAGLVTNPINFMGKLVYDAAATRATEKTRDTRDLSRMAVIKSWAYIIQLKPPGECWIINFVHDQVTGGDTNFRMSFNFNFDGSPIKAVSATALNQFGF